MCDIFNQKTLNSIALVVVNTTAMFLYQQKKCSFLVPFDLSEVEQVIISPNYSSFCALALSQSTRKALNRSHVLFECHQMNLLRDYLDALKGEGLLNLPKPLYQESFAYSEDIKLDSLRAQQSQGGSEETKFADQKFSDILEQKKLAVQRFNSGTVRSTLEGKVFIECLEYKSLFVKTQLVWQESFMILTNVGLLIYKSPQFHDQVPILVHLDSLMIDFEKKGKQSNGRQYLFEIEDRASERRTKTVHCRKDDAKYYIEWDKSKLMCSAPQAIDHMNW